MRQIRLVPLYWRMLTYADECWRMLTWADVCGRMRQYADVCWRMLICRRVLVCDVCGRMRAYTDVCWHAEEHEASAPLLDNMQTYADVCGRMLTYAGVCWRMLACRRVWGLGTTAMPRGGGNRGGARIRDAAAPAAHESGNVWQHTSAYVSIRQHTSPN
jgi:hypothetical protein